MLFQIKLVPATVLGAALADTKARALVGKLFVKVTVGRFVLPVLTTWMLNCTVLPTSVWLGVRSVSVTRMAPVPAGIGTLAVSEDTSDESVISV